MLLAALKEYHLTARKAVIAKTADYKTEIVVSLLNSLIDTASNVGRNKLPPRESTISEIYGVIQSYHKTAEENLARLSDKHSPQLDGCRKHIQTEIEILEGYLSEFAELLPKKLSKEQLENIIKGFLAEASEDPKKIMGITMAHLKTHYPDQYDGKAASELIKSHM